MYHVIHTLGLKGFVYHVIHNFTFGLKGFVYHVIHNFGLKGFVYHVIYSFTFGQKVLCIMLSIILAYGFCVSYYPYFMPKRFCVSCYP